MWDGASKLQDTEVSKKKKKLQETNKLTEKPIIWDCI